MSVRPSVCLSVCTFRPDNKQDRHTCYPRDAMLARYMPWPFVCLSIRSRSSIETVERFFGKEAICCKINGNTFRNFVQNSELSRVFFCFFSPRTSIVASVVNVVRPKTVVCLSPWASIFVYITMGVTQRVARVRLLHLRLVNVPKQTVS